MIKYPQIAGFIIVFLWSSQPAYAYLDPGTGSIIIQSIIGGIAAATTFGAVYWAKIKTFLKGKKDDTDKK